MVAFSVVDSDAVIGDVIWFDTDVDEYVDTLPLEVVVLIVEISSVIVVFPVVRELLSVLVVFKPGVTLSVVELSCVLFWVLLLVGVEEAVIFVVEVEVVDGNVDDDEGVDDDAE